MRPGMQPSAGSQIFTLGTGWRGARGSSRVSPSRSPCSGEQGAANAFLQRFDTKQKVQAYPWLLELWISNTPGGKRVGYQAAHCRPGRLHIRDFGWQISLLYQRNGWGFQIQSNQPQIMQWVHWLVVILEKFSRGTQATCFEMYRIQRVPHCHWKPWTLSTDPFVVLSHLSLFTSFKDACTYSEVMWSNLFGIFHFWKFLMALQRIASVMPTFFSLSSFATLSYPYTLYFSKHPKPKTQNPKPLHPGPYP